MVIPETVPSEKIIVCIPVYNDWDATLEVLRRLDAAAVQWAFPAEVLLVDDGSVASLPAELPMSLPNLRSLEVLRLLRNVGHQRAIAIGLTYIVKHRPCRAVVVMDGDGEDAAEDVIKLLERHEALNGTKVVFAKRARRTEGIVFGLCYQAFKVVHRILTGRKVEVGNFSIIPAQHLKRLAAVSELWNHYAASVFKARIPTEMIPIDRGRRLSGRSKMDFVSLVAHGLSAISVFADVVGVRLLLSTVLLAAVSLLGLVVGVAIRVGTGWAIPGWATMAGGFLVLALLQAFVMSFGFVFVTLRGRNDLTFLPLRDYRYFVEKTYSVTLH
jgi:polyisoprenyl-phosphate glycosyltransferase